MSELVRVALPFPPSVNNLFATGSGGRRFRSRRYLGWARQAGWDLLAQRTPAISGPVAISVHLTPPDRAKRRDADNYLKPILDLLVAHGVLPADDARVVRQVGAQWVAGDQPRALVLISRVSRGDDDATNNPSERRATAAPPEAGRRDKAVPPPSRKARACLTQQMRRLIAQGVLVVLPGLLDDAPQGIAIAPGLEVGDPAQGVPSVRARRSRR